MPGQAAIQEAEVKMGKALEYTLHEFDTIHTGKASPTMVESVSVEAYGSSMRVKEMAAITTPDPRTIVIQPWDKSVLQSISKAILQANIGLNPAVDGDIIRCPIPEMSRERRQEMVKTTGAMAEEGKVRIRNARRDAIDAIKAAQKEGAISEDDAKRYEKEVQALTDKFTGEIGTHLASKEKELMQV